MPALSCPWCDPGSALLLAVHICILITGAALMVPWILVLPGWSLALCWLAAATSFLLACY
jgi:uncharacterized protein (DUF983 family)